MSEKADYTSLDLPKNRVQMLLDVLKHDFFLVLRVSLMQSFFALPLITIAVVLSFILTALPKEQLHELAFPFIFWAGIFAVPCFGLYFAGLSGGYLIAKKRVFGQGSLFASDFLSAVKSIGKRCFVCGILVGASVLLLESLTLFMLGTNAGPIAKGLAIGIASLQFIILRCTADYFLCAQCVYELNFASCLKNSFAFALTRFAPNFLGLLLFTVIPVALSFFGIWLELVVILINILFIGGLSSFTKTLYAHSVFDKYINAEHYPEYVKKGLAK